MIKIKKSNIFDNKQGLSGVITAVIMIALVFALITIVWVVVNNLIQDELSDVESCFGVFETVTINNRYTCYNSTSNEFQFSISVGDIHVDEVLVSISGEGTTRSLRITNNTSTIDNLRTYPSGSSEIKLPGRNSGLTYVYDLDEGGFGSELDSIEIAPIINGKQCEVSDSLFEIDNCFSLS